MVKSAAKHMFCTAKVLAWVAITICFATLEDEALRTFTVVGVIALGCIFLLLE